MLFFAGVVSPALGFINFNTMIFTFVADHYQYYAFIGVIVLVVESVLMLLKRFGESVPSITDRARFLRLTTTLLWSGILLALVVLTNFFSHLYTSGDLLWGFNRDHNRACAMVSVCLAGSQMDSHPPRVKAAIETLETALQRSPDNWRLHHSLGTIYLDLGQTELGLKHLLKVEELLPESVRRQWARDYRRTATAAMEMDNADSVLAASSPQFLMGRHYAKLGEWDKAIEAFMKDLDEHPTHLSAYISIGQCCLGKADYEAALVWFDKVIDAAPCSAEAWLGKGLALRGLNQEQQAVKAFMEAQQLDPAGRSLLQYPELFKSAQPRE